MTAETSLPETDTSEMLSLQPKGGLSAGQRATLIGMGIVILILTAVLVLVLRTGSAIGSVDVLATVMAAPTPTPTPPAFVPDAVPTPSDLYWPPDPQPLSTPNAPSDLLWWDARFAYRQPILLDVVAAGMPAGTWAQVLFDSERARRESKMRVDGADLRVLIWDGHDWWEIPRQARPRRAKSGWQILFHVQDLEIARQGEYYLYFGNPFAESPPVAQNAPETSRLLLTLGEQENVEWGPEVVWTANSATAQTLVSPDGRIVIRCPPGGPRETVRVKLRTVPLGERSSTDPLPDFELHADPPPGPPSSLNVAQWDPPLSVTINWAGLPVDVQDLQSRVHFAYDQNTGAWYSFPIEFDEQRGTTRLTTDQP
jgi:hypothetical protein